MDAAVGKSKVIIALVRGGKRVHQDCYIHISSLITQPVAVQRLVEQARSFAQIDQDDFNVIRLSQKQQVAFLRYAEFFEDPFPKLATACLIDLVTKRVRRTDFSARDNPPILHRKELLLAPDHPDRPQLSALTEALEKRGLFTDSQRIGYKKQWEQRLASHGIRISNQEITEIGNAQTERETQREIDRHKTAIARDRLSAPMQALARHGLLSPDRDVLDYGCGQGDDVRALQAGGIPATGWDPHFAPTVPLKAADIVNVGFVLNVIEEPRERLQAIRRAFDLARHCLSVAVMVLGKGDTETHKPYRDGFLTSRGTFQKYYRQEELKEFLDEALGNEALAVGPGVFFVFKDKLLEQRFLLDRQRRIQIPIAPSLRPPLDRPTLAERRLEALRPVLLRLWGRMLEMGRPLVDDELAPDLLIDIEQQIGSLRRAERLCSTQFDVNELAAAGNARKEDLLVYFALNLFNRRTRYSTLVPELQRDIKVFFGNATSSFELARTLLFSVGKTDVVAEACRRAAAQQCGYLLENHSLQIHCSRINRLPAALRCYVGCAAKLYGDVDIANIVKIHVHSGKLTLLFYDDFDTSPLPRLRERVKINMRTQKIDFFQHSNGSEQQLLYLKSRYMTPDQAGYLQQKTFDNDLARLGLFDFSGYGPPVDVFSSELAKASYAVRGFRLVRENDRLAIPE